MKREVCTNCESKRSTSFCFCCFLSVNILCGSLLTIRSLTGFLPLKNNNKFDFFSRFCDYITILILFHHIFDRLNSRVFFCFCFVVVFAPQLRLPHHISSIKCYILIHMHQLLFVTKTYGTSQAYTFNYKMNVIRCFSSSFSLIYTKWKILLPVLLNKIFAR